MAALADLLREQKRTILETWSQRVRQTPEVPIARELSRPALVDNLPDLIDDLVTCLNNADTADMAARIACGRELGHTRAAEAHAAHRTAEGYSVRQAMLELSLFRMVLIEVVASTGADVGFEDMMIAHAALDEAMRTCAHEMQQVNVAAALGESNARKDVLRVVSHDLRNPLNTIVLAAETLASSDSEATARKAGVIMRNAHQMERLIDDLSDINAMESGALSVTPKPERIADLVRDAVANQQERAGKKGVELLCDTSIDDLVQADSLRVQQVLGNLIANAIEVLTAGGHVWISVALDSDQAIFCVRDDGPGIDADHQSLVFDRFWRAPKTRYVGTGLGLAISRGIVEALGGRIWVESELGKGAAFYFTLQRSTLTRTGPNAS